MESIPSTVIEFDIENHTTKKLSIDEFKIEEGQVSKIYWVHCNTNEEEVLKQLSFKLKLPDNIISLCHVVESIPKLIDEDDALTLQIQCVLSTEITKKNTEVDFDNLLIYLTPLFCFTATPHAPPAIKEFEASYSKSVRYAKTPCFILFLLLDNVINDYGKILFSLEMIADQLDLRILSEEKNIYNDVMDVKRQLIKVKRYSIAIREFLMRISSRTIAVISEQCRLSLSNLSSHSHTIVHEVDTIRDMLNGLLDQIDNTLMQHMNETMKVLTAFAAIFLPLTLITGIYGMNFHWMPELDWKYGYFGALLLILLCGVVLYLIFKKKKWI